MATARRTNWFSFIATVFLLVAGVSSLLAPIMHNYGFYFAGMIAATNGVVCAILSHHK